MAHKIPDMPRVEPWHGLDNPIRRKVKRTKLTAWDLALIDQLLQKHLREIAFTQGAAYRASVEYLANNIKRATIGSLTEK